LEGVEMHAQVRRLVRLFAVTVMLVGFAVTAYAHHGDDTIQAPYGPSQPASEITP
jgi:hypothetical protein